MSLLSLTQDAMILCGLTSPSVVYASTDATVALFKKLSIVEGDHLSRRGDWRQMKVLAQMTGDGTSTEFSLPTDFDRFMTGYPFWLDDSPSLPLFKVTDDEMLAMKVAETTPTRPVWRLFGDSIEFYPAPDSAEVIKMEYRSKYWIADSTGATRRAAWAADDDISLIPDRLVTLGLIWRFKQAKGFDYAEDFRTYQIEVERAVGQSNGRQTLTARANFFGDYADAGMTDPQVVV